MFFRGSRYEGVPTTRAATADGREVTMVKVPLAARPATLRGYHRRTGDQRLDHLASHYLSDANGFWRLCDVSGTVVPDALAARDLVAIPKKG